MQLLRARFENFRLLRDLEVDFSNDPQKKLTVIRAANESGKTTLLTALQWALYGDDALPNKGTDFRLHPIDWRIAESARIPITATVEFQVVRYNRIAGIPRESRRRYRIIRSAVEELSGTEWRRGASTVRLFALTDIGADPIDSPDAVIADELPPELREVFFTDGDRALSFIESDVALSTKRERVQRAIRSLLGLSVIEDALRHVKRAASDINKQARQMGGGSELSTIATRLEAMADELVRREAELADAKEQFAAFDEAYRDTDRKIADVLKRGDREKLARDLADTKKTIARLHERIDAAIKQHSALFRSEALGRDILAPVLSKGFEILKDLRDQKKFPKTAIPVLEERLGAELCICGESLKDDSGDGSRRRVHICGLIEDSRRTDEIQETITNLYYSSKSLEQGAVDAEATWLSLYTAVVAERDNLQGVRDDEERKYKALEQQLESIPDADIQALREVRQGHAAQRDRFNALRSKIERRSKGLRKSKPH
jgi:DNA sulfur modification protein DndD